MRAGTGEIESSPTTCTVNELGQTKQWEFRQAVRRLMTAMKSTTEQQNFGVYEPAAMTSEHSIVILLRIVTTLIY